MKRLATSVLMGLATIGVGAQTDSSRPRLVVGIVVDQLRTDYIEYLQNYFGERGFRTLMDGAVYMPDVDFKVPFLDATNATAMICTGAYPSQTGVPAAMMFDPAVPGGASRLPLVNSGTSTLTNDSFSPEGLRLSTLADELVVGSDGNSSVYSVAMDPQQAVILAGHAGKGAFWVNNSSGNWATTSYYGSMPGVVADRNMRRSLSQRIDTMTWRPLAATLQLPDISSRQRAISFKYTFSRGDRDVYKKFASSPLANAEVTDVAIDLISRLDLGDTPGETDMLNIAYTLAPHRYGSDNGARLELADSYLRLDSQLGRLFDAIDRKVGRGNAVIWLTSTGHFDDALPVDPKYRIPTGEFSTRRARSLLNSYLSARYGSGEYVSAFRDGRLYFDRQTLESGHHDADKIIDDARAFIVRMNGVADARTINEVLSPGTDADNALRLALDPRTGGDIIVSFWPGWTVNYDEQQPVKSQIARECAVRTPAFILAPGLRRQTLDNPVNATAIAPTLAGSLHIRSPNGARDRALSIPR